MLTFNVDVISELRIRTNQNALHFIVLKVHRRVFLCWVKTVFSYFISYKIEEPGQHIRSDFSPVKTSNLPDKCSMTGANLQACKMKKIPHFLLVLLLADHHALTLLFLSFSQLLLPFCQFY